MNTRITGTGSSVPAKKLTNDDLSKIVDTSDEWIRTRTGIGKRHVAENETAASLAAEAAKLALENASIQATDIDMIITATSSPDYAFPNTASIVQKLIGAQHAACFDISVACTGFIYALNIADAYIKSGMHNRILVIGSEVMSTQVDWNDRSVCVLFGDGAGAVVLEKDEDGLNVTSLHTDGARGEVLTCGMRQKAAMETLDYISMNGQEVFKFAVKSVPESIKEVLEKSSAKIEDVKYFVLHQANIRIIEAVAKRLEIDMDRFPTNLEDYGNTSAASIPILLDEMNRKNILKKDDLIIMSGFGAGLSWGSTLIKW